MFLEYEGKKPLKKRIWILIGMLFFLWGFNFGMAISGDSLFEINVNCHALA